MAIPSNAQEIRFHLALALIEDKDYKPSDICEWVPWLEQMITTGENPTDNKRLVSLEDASELDGLMEKVRSIAKRK